MYIASAKHSHNCYVDLLILQQWNQGEVSIIFRINKQAWITIHRPILLAPASSPINSSLGLAGRPFANISSSYFLAISNILLSINLLQSKHCKQTRQGFTKFLHLIPHYKRNPHLEFLAQVLSTVRQHFDAYCIKVFFGFFPSSGLQWW